MTIKLSYDDNKKLTDILAQHPSFETSDGRRAMLKVTLAGTAEGKRVLSMLDLDAAPFVVAVNVIDQLCGLGRISPEREALGVMINYLLDLTGQADENYQFLTGLVKKYQLDQPVSTVSTTTTNVDPSFIPSDLANAPIEPVLCDISAFGQAIQAASAILRIRGANSVCTGFLAGPELVMTVDIMVGDRPNADACIYQFNYQLDDQGKSLAPVGVRTRPNGLYYTNHALALSIVELQPIPPEAEAQPLKLSRQSPPRGDPVSVIQHPGGSYKKASFWGGRVLRADENHVAYTSSTLPGSSGSPVLNEEFEAIAIHHASRKIDDPNTGQVFYVKEGISMIAILADLKQNAPEIYARMNIID